MLPIKYTLLKEGIKISLLSRSGTCPTLGQHTPHTHNPTLILPDGLQPALTATFHPHEEQDVTQRVTLFTELFVWGGTGRNREGPGHRGNKQRGKMLNPAPLTHTPQTTAAGLELSHNYYIVRASVLFFSRCI